MKKYPDPIYLSYYLLQCADDKRRNKSRREKFRQAAKLLRDMEFDYIEKDKNDPNLSSAS